LVIALLPFVYVRSR